MELLQILLFSIPIFFLFLWARHINSNTKKAPPGPTGVPIVGSLLDLGTFPNQSLAQLAKGHDLLMTIRLGSIPIVVASLSAIAQQIFQRHEEAFSDRKIPDVITAEPNPESTLAWVPGDHKWRNRRRFYTSQLFSTHRIDKFQHLRCDKVRQLIQHLNKHSLSGTAVDLGQAAFGTTLNLCPTPF